MIHKMTYPNLVRGQKEKQKFFQTLFYNGDIQEPMVCFSKYGDFMFFYQKKILWTCLQPLFLPSNDEIHLNKKACSTHTLDLNFYQCLLHPTYNVNYSLINIHKHETMDIRKWKIIEMSSLEPIIIIDQSNPFPIEYQRTQLGPKWFGRSQLGKNKQTNNILE